MPVKAVWTEHGGDYPRLHWQLDEGALDALGRFGTVRPLVRGEVVFDQGQESEALYLVLEGGIAISRDGKQLGIVAPHHTFGEMGLLLDLPRSARATALADGRVLEMDRGDLDRMMGDDPVWAARLFKVLAECLAEYLHRASSARPSPTGRFHPRRRA